MINVSDLKPGVTFQMDGNLFVVLDYSHNKTARAAANIKVKMKNLRTGSTTEMTFGGNDKVKRAQIDKKEMQYLYNTGDAFVFMDGETYEQIEIPAENLEWEKNFLKESDTATIRSFEGEVLGVQLPDKVTLQITEAEQADSKSKSLYLLMKEKWSLFQLLKENIQAELSTRTKPSVFSYSKTGLHIVGNEGMFMNKQAITFLSLFTLILVLSIYYLLVPPIDQSDTVSKKSLSRIEILQSELNKNHENKINDNNTVIASSKASEKEISTALTSNEKTKAIIKNEKDICQLLTDKGYKECFCEIDGGHMKVVVKLKDATSKDANKIIKLIHNKYNGYIIEVKFVED